MFLGFLASHSRGLHWVDTHPVQQPGGAAVTVERIASQVSASVTNCYFQTSGVNWNFDNLIQFLWICNFFVHFAKHHLLAKKFVNQELTKNKIVSQQSLTNKIKLSRKLENNLQRL